MNDQTICPCGKPLHYRDPAYAETMRKLIEDLGPNVALSSRYQTYSVPRHYVALHGVPLKELDGLAARHSWPAISRV